MRYESEFRIKEKEFRPRKDFNHDKVINELSNIVKAADADIEHYEKSYYKTKTKLNTIQSKYQSLNNINSFLIGYFITSIVVLLGASLLWYVNGLKIYSVKKRNLGN